MTPTVTAFGDRLLDEGTARNRIRRRLRRTSTGRCPGELLLHPLWIARARVVADRPPFRPLVRPVLIFVDAVSTYRGLMAETPATQQLAVGAAAVHRPHVGREEAHHWVRDVQQQQIDRSYLLRKPRHELVGLELLHLPLWRFDPGDGGTVAVVNAVTGGDESYLASRWP